MFFNQIWNRKFGDDINGRNTKLMTVHLSTILQHLLYFLPTLRVCSSPSHCSAQCQKWFLIGSIHSPTASHPLTFEACQPKAWQLFFTKHETKGFYSGENAKTTCTGWKWTSNWKFLAIFFHVFALASQIQIHVLLGKFRSCTRQRMHCWNWNYKSLVVSQISKFTQSSKP